MRMRSGPARNYSSSCSVDASRGVSGETVVNWD